MLHAQEEKTTTKTKAGPKPTTQCSKNYNVELKLWA